MAERCRRGGGDIVSWVPDPEAGRLTPYLDWWQATDAKAARSLVPVPPIAALDTLSLTTPTSGQAGGAGAVDIPQDILVPLPAAACAKDQPRPAFDAMPTDLAARVVDVPEDAVIIGVIDTDIALGHERFRGADGKSRVLASWQQSSAHVGQGHVAFGHELYQSDIDELTAEHGDAASGWLDEGAFNVAAGLTDMAHAQGHRGFEREAAHGTHVLDLAAGLDPNAPTDAFGDRTRILTVNMPSRATIGSSGSFLEYFVQRAILRMVALADAIWAAKLPAERRGAVVGYPMVINLSYGLHAGPKDGSMPVERMIARLLDDLNAGWHAPVRITLPVGNDNLEQGAATWVVAPGEVCGVDWHVLPEDQSANYLEVWSDVMDAPWGAGTPAPFEIGFTAPGGTELPLGGGHPGSIAEFGFARVYCRKVTQGPEGAYRVRYVICTAPTVGFDRSVALAPAGRWDVRARYAGAGASQRGISMVVQSDQTVGSGGETGLASYLMPQGEAVYHSHDPQTGAVIDSLRYPFKNTVADWQEDAAAQGGVTRAGTHNAIATMEQVVVAAGYRRTDGAPAEYSSTMPRVAVMGARSAPTASYPTDDGAMHLGILAAGAKSRSVVAFQGTSFACAQAARQTAVALLDWQQGDPVPDVRDAWLAEMAHHKETAEGLGYWQDAVTQARILAYPDQVMWRVKLGHGRLPRPDAGHRATRF